ncbi:hypothetical protein V1460_33260 [Streptomyces sp. SCSIO 30461]
MRPDPAFTRHGAAVARCFDGVTALLDGGPAESAETAGDIEADGVKSVLD